MIHWLTLSFGSTSSWAGTRIQTLVVDTCFSKRAFSISPTSSNTLSILTDEASWAAFVTGTENTASSFNTFFIVQAFVITTTSNPADGIFAISAQTTSVVCITSLYGTITFGERISSQSSWTCAVNRMVYHITVGIGAASS